MAEAAKQLKILSHGDGKEESEKLNIKEKVFNTHTEELIIALCGPIGTNIHFVAEILERVLSEKYNYQCKTIRLSNLIRQYSSDSSSSNNAYEAYNDLIDKGNQLREKHGKNILAELAINEIAVNRELAQPEDTFQSTRICYIIDSLKNKEELDLLRLIYRDIFYFVGVFSPLDIRVKNLEQKEIKIHEVYKLIDRDSGEEIQFGQMVTDTFVESDFFLRVDSGATPILEQKINRFLHLVFASDVITPTSDETAMYLAYAAAGNSACLSRQVGASITDKKGEVISVGWNDVPKSGGGVYQFDSENLQNDKRCINLDEGKCFNDYEKEKISNALIDTLANEGIIQHKDKKKALTIIKKSRIKELIEFSRAVHAEMLAIISGSQKTGGKMIDGKLYCTTYPCHNCARHIVAAGIKEVYYIEPYRKSLATKLHNDAITEDEGKEELVRILMFDGVAPRRYLDFFKMLAGSRKKNGKKITENSSKKYPKNTLSLQAIPILEKKVTEDLKSKNLINV